MTSFLSNGFAVVLGWMVEVETGAGVFAAAAATGVSVSPLQ
jgi:hypothetical protein